MTEENLPRWSVRLDAARAGISDYSDLLSLVNQHFRVHQSANEFLGPYNARQRNSSFPYIAPDRQMLQTAIKQGGMNQASYSAFITQLIRFCEQFKGNRALPEPHPSIIHSIQLPVGAFELKTVGDETHVHIVGITEPLIVKGLRDTESIKFLIVRPKLSKLGTASAKNWEVLFFRSAFGYIPEWVDSNLNPRYSGIF